MSQSDPECKLILLGNGSVGKSSIICRFVDDGFTRVYKQTVGLDFFEKRLNLRGDKRVLLQVWDIGGQSINSSMILKYIYGASIVFLCYDVTDPQSFADVEDWHKLVLRTFNASTGSEISKAIPKLYLVGNKIDLIHLRRITDKQHATLCTALKADGHFYVSAQNGDNVLKSFYQAAATSVNISLTQHELAFADRVVTASIAHTGDEGRTAMADEIEREDMEWEARKTQPSKCHCNIS